MSSAKPRVDWTLQQHGRSQQCRGNNFEPHKPENYGNPYHPENQGCLNCGNLESCAAALESQRSECAGVQFDSGNVFFWASSPTCGACANKAACEVAMRARMMTCGFPPHCHEPEEFGHPYSRKSLACRACGLDQQVLCRGDVPPLSLPTAYPVSVIGVRDRREHPERYEK